ncbi:MAG: ABC transporter permease subunit [Gammaproteobacteria bacterium]|nr:ABC transporter permease subunit [Gammaproteobacteria bacterium]
MNTAAITNSKKPQKLRAFSPWTVMNVFFTFTILMPIITICAYLFQPPSENWGHLVDTVLPDYIQNSLWLMIGVAFGVTSMGTITAWLTSMYQFPGRRLLIWALLLPLAMPAYIIAYTYTGMLDASGPVQEGIRDAFGLKYGEYWFPEIRSIGGAIAMLSLVLYPYVYLLARAAFINQSVCVLEASRTLGCGAWGSFLQVGLPLARPAIVAGLSLALMETLADFGTVQYFGVSTFTTGIFRTWFGMYDAVAASQLAALLMLFVFVLVLMERWSRRRARFHHTTNQFRRLPEAQLSPGKAWLATLACFLPLLFGFLIPVSQLILWAFATYQEMLDDRFIELAINSFMLAGAAAILVLIPALSIGYRNRTNPSIAMTFCTRLASMGYAIPSTVIAIGVLIPFGAMDNLMNDWMSDHFGIQTGLLLTGTVFILLFAYTVRFLAVSLQTVEAGLGKIKPSMDDSARSMGLSRGQVMQRVHLPIMKGSLLTAIVIVFVDVLKELPATLMLRPFNFNTLAVRAYELASDERLADSSTAALAIVAVGIIPVVLLSSAISRSRAGS